MPPPAFEPVDTPDTLLADEPTTSWPVYHHLMHALVVLVLLITAAGIIVQLLIHKTIFMTTSTPQLDVTSARESPIMVAGTNGCLYRYTEIPAAVSWAIVITAALIVPLALTILVTVLRHATRVTDLTLSLLSVVVLLTACLTLIITVPQLAIHSEINGWLQLCSPI